MRLGGQSSSGATQCVEHCLSVTQVLCVEPEKKEKKKNFAPEEEQNIDSKREWTKKCDETVG